MPPAYLSRSSVKMSLGSIGLWPALRHVFAGRPYFSVASARCRRHQNRALPLRRLPTETISHWVAASGEGVSPTSAEEYRVARLAEVELDRFSLVAACRISGLLIAPSPSGSPATRAVEGFVSP